MKVARLYYRLVKFEHTIFALPFAYVGAFLAVDGVPGAHDLLWVTVAMVAARSLAMGLNRLIDARLDARNPRTAGRELPAGLLSPAAVAAPELPFEPALALAPPLPLPPTAGLPPPRALLPACPVAEPPSALPAPPSGGASPPSSNAPASMTPLLVRPLLRRGCT